MAFAGRWMLGLMAGESRDRNPIYSLLQVVTEPVIKGVRLLAPGAIRDRYLPIAAFSLVAAVWLIATIFKISLCLRIGVQQCL